MSTLVSQSSNVRKVRQNSIIILSRKSSNIGNSSPIVLSDHTGFRPASIKSASTTSIHVREDCDWPQTTATTNFIGEQSDPSSGSRNASRDQQPVYGDLKASIFIAKPQSLSAKSSMPFHLAPTGKAQVTVPSILEDVPQMALTPHKFTSGGDLSY